MKALRLILHQHQACYRKAETVDNKMTYPLPPYSTVIGALHKACGYREYHPMDVSIQGSFGSMQKEPYMDHAFLDNLQDDRGILVKLNHADLLSKGYEIAAKANKQGSSFDEEKSISIVNRDLLREYQDLRRARRCWSSDYENPIYDYESEPCLFTADNKKAKEEEAVRKSIVFQDGDILRQVEIVRHLNEKYLTVKAKKAEQNGVLKTLEKNSPDYIRLKAEIKNLTDEEKKLKAEGEEAKEIIEKRYRRFASLTTSLKYYEVLYDVHLVLHIAGEEEVLQDIADHISVLTAIGRSEDFVDVEECKMVELRKDISEQVDGVLSAYVNMAAIRSEAIYAGDTKAEAKNIGKMKANGTKYLLDKDYHIEDKKRIFHKVPVLYTSNYSVDEDSDGNDSGVYLDIGDETYIVSFV